LPEAGFEDQVAAAIATIKTPSAAALKKGIKALFKRKLDCAWRDHVEAVANAALMGQRDEPASAPPRAGNDAVNRRRHCVPH
jgi:hypothetical protein